MRITTVLPRALRGYARARKAYPPLRWSRGATGPRLIEVVQPAHAEALLNVVATQLTGHRAAEAEECHDRVHLVYDAASGWHVVVRERLIFSASDLLMLDLDGIDEATCRTTLESMCEKDESLRFRVHRTTNGFHAFLLSAPCDARDPRTLDLAREAGADMRYAWRAFAKGTFDVRLSRKMAGDVVEEPYGDFGAGRVDSRLSGILRCYELLVDWVRDDPVGITSANTSEWIALLALTCEGIEQSVFGRSD
jgi:hypothetical protein